MRNAPGLRRHGAAPTGVKRSKGTMLTATRPIQAAAAAA
jgi:hypothetical protein